MYAWSECCPISFLCILLEIRHRESVDWLFTEKVWRQILWILSVSIYIFKDVTSPGHGQMLTEYVLRAWFSSTSTFASLQFSIFKCDKPWHQAYQRLIKFFASIKIFQCCHHGCIGTVFRKVNKTPANCNKCVKTRQRSLTCQNVYVFLKWRIILSLWLL